MPVDKQVLLRYQVLNRCFRNKYREYTIDDLVDECNKALRKADRPEVSKRTIQNDIAQLETTDPYYIRLNENLKRENRRVNAELQERNEQVAGLNSEKASLSEKVAIAAQLDATNIQMILLDKKDRSMKKPKLKDCKKIQVSFTITRNVTASNGNRTVYVRIQNPGGNVLSGGGSFDYENRSLECSMKKSIEYTGEERPVTLYWPVTQVLETGQYRVSVFVDGNMIGSRTFNFEK